MSTIAGLYNYDDVPRCASQFTGKERDTETGLDYFGARYYGSNMGRFLSPDWSVDPTPVPYADMSDPQTLNLYGYVRNNPLYKADADGHDWNDSLQFLGGVVKGVASSVTYGYVGAPSPNDSAASLSGQLVGTGMVATTGTSLVSSSGPTLGPALVAAPETLGASLAVPAAEAIGGTVLATGAAKNAGALVVAMAGGPKAATSPGVSSSGQATDEHGNKLGGSNKPQQHETTSNTREGARNKALNEGSSAVNHSNPKQGDPHYHAGDAQGNKKPNSTHHKYPDN